MKGQKRQKKASKTQHMRRNAATPPRGLSRAIVARPRKEPSEPSEPPHQNEEGTPGWRAIKAVGGMLATTVAGAYLARQNMVNPKVLSGLISGIGAAIAIEGPPKWQSVGLGAMSAAGGQLGFMLIDDQLIKSADDQGRQDQLASKAPTQAPTKRQASDIPADALARAYERARLRMALASDAPN